MQYFLTLSCLVLSSFLSACFCCKDVTKTYRSKWQTHILYDLRRSNIYSAFSSRNIWITLNLALLHVNEAGQTYSCVKWHLTICFIVYLVHIIYIILVWICNKAWYIFVMLMFSRKPTIQPCHSHSPTWSVSQAHQWETWGWTLLVSCKSSTDHTLTIHCTQPYTSSCHLPHCYYKSSTDHRLTIDSTLPYITSYHLPHCYYKSSTDHR